MKRARFVVGGVTLCLLLAFLAVDQRNAEAQNDEKKPGLPPISKKVLVPLGASAIPPLPVDLKAEGIESLLNILDAIVTQKAVLEKIQMEVTSVLNEKLKEQQERVQKLGIPPARPRFDKKG